MMKWSIRGTVAVAAAMVVCASFVPTVRADLHGELLFDSYSGDFNGSTAEGIGSQIEFTTETTIGAIGVLNSIQRTEQENTSPLLIKFLIFDSEHALIDVPGLEPQPFFNDPSAAPTWKLSNNFELTLAPGTYFIGAIDNSGASKGADWVYDDATATSADGTIRSLIPMPVFENYAEPTFFLSNHDGSVRLFGVVPEPATLVMWSLAGGLAWLFAWRKRARRC